ncbi:MAG: hypothetical protein JNL43_02115 [Flavobacteriales bacterium]|nr:hypothetical protein [Flavobacteriales bacterium]
MRPKHFVQWAFPFVPLVFLATSARVGAQDIHHYVAVVSGLTTTMQEKQLLMVLAGSDDLGEFTVDRGTGEIGIKTRFAMDRARFDHLIGRYNLHILSFRQIDAPQYTTTQGPRTPRMADMPLYIDTGDPVRDNQRYDAYKAAWIAVHPDEYRELSAPLGSAPTSGTD